jgi:hypothetical protein
MMNRLIPLWHKNPPPDNTLSRLQGRPISSRIKAHKKWREFSDQLLIVLLSGFFCIRVLIGDAAEGDISHGITLYWNSTKRAFRSSLPFEQGQEDEL